uniref:Uncharacterized protein n=1 Tax=Cannabis sativa TaxID=3483 RepID=A0A803NL90_CANSA
MEDVNPLSLEHAQPNNVREGDKSEADDREDGYYYGQDPKVIQVSKELQETQEKLARQEKLSQKRERMMACLQDKFRDLEEDSEEEPSVELVEKTTLKPQLL